MKKLALILCAGFLAAGVFGCQPSGDAGKPPVHPTPACTKCGQSPCACPKPAPAPTPAPAPAPAPTAK